MIVSVNNSDVKIGQKALSGVKSLSKRNKKIKQRKQKKQQAKKEKPAHDEATLKKMRENREATNKMRMDRWKQVIADVSGRSDLSDVHKLMLEKLAEPQFANGVPRKSKKGFINFLVLSCQFEAKHTESAEELFSILKTAEGSVPMAERKSKKLLKKKLRKEKRIAQKKQKEAEEQMEQDDDGDIDMEANVKTEVKSEGEGESGDDLDGGETVQVKGRSKKNRRKLEKVGKKVLHLQGKLNKNKKGKGKDNKKRRSK